MLKNKFLITFLISLLLVNNSSFAQNNNKIKTVENVDGKKRRITTYDSLMNKIREEYYGNPNSQYERDEDQQLIAAIDYNQSKIIRVIGYNKFPEIEYKVDFINGTYYDKLKGVSLKFKDNFIFDGLQQGDKILVEYKNGIKNGKLIQTDSAISTKSPIASKKVDPRFLQFNIVNFYSSLSKEDNYKLFKGVNFNFQNGRIQGKQSSYYLSGKIKFNSEFESGILMKYNSFDEDGNFISKINTQNGFASGIQLLNGVPISDTNLIFFNYRINETGNITYNNDDVVSTKDWRNSLRSGNVNVEDIYGHIASTIFLSEGEPYFDNNGNKYYNLKTKLEFNRDSAYTLRFKQIFDNKKVTFTDPRVIKYLLNIPDFEITRFEFNSDEDKFIIPVSMNTVKRNNIQNLKIDSISLGDGFYFKHYDFKQYDFDININYRKYKLKFLFEPDSYIKTNFPNINWYDYPTLIYINQELTYWTANTFNINTPFNEQEYLIETAVNGYANKIFKYNYEFNTNKLDLEKFIIIFKTLIDFIKNNQNELIKNRVELPFLTNETTTLFNEKFIGKMNSAIDIKNIDGDSYIKIVTKNDIEIKYLNKKYKIIADRKKSKWIIYLI